MTNLSAIAYEPVDGLHREGAVIELDGKWFSNCTFTDCTLIFRGIKPFGYAHTRFDRCRMNFTDHAQMTLSIVARMIPDMIDGDTLADALHTLAAGGLIVN